MLLVVGGLASGKRAFARSLGFADSDVSASLSASCPVLEDAQELVRDESVDEAALAEQVASAKSVVLCADIGAGIVPMDAGERAWRERAGRFGQLLAARADAVVRMVCGTPQVLKGALPQVPAQVPDSKAPVQAGASFFQNRACPYFPCHDGVHADEFNCLFCYCPLYALGPACGGDFSYTESGRKNCTACAKPHVRDCGAELVAGRYAELAQLAAAK